MEMQVVKTLEALVLPPGVNFAVVLAGLAIAPWRRRLGIFLVIAAVLSLYLLSTPLVARALHAGVERYPPLTTDEAVAARAGAIVVLGGGRHAGAVEYGGDTVSSRALARLRYAARLHAATGLPVLVTGGRVFGEGISEAQLMQAALADFGIAAAWLEERSRNTAENASYSADILREAGVSRILLVTEAVHMLRSVEMFAREGLDVVPAPTLAHRHSRGDVPTFMQLLPRAAALAESSVVLHEQIGRLWYRLRY